MGRINDYLTEAGTFFLATADGNQPKVRPLGAHVELDGKVWFGVGTFKEVYMQLQTNPLVELVACKTDGHWLRMTGKVVFSDDPKYAEAMLESMPHLRNIYNEETGNKLGMFYIDADKAVDIPIMGEGESLL